MKLDSCFATQVDTVHDVPEPLRSALIDKIGSPEAVRFLLYVPAVSTIDERSPRPAPPMIPEILVPATVLGITRDGWVVACEAEDGDATVEASSFSDTLFLELTSVLLYGQLRIDFASVGRSYSVLTQFNAVKEELFRDTIGLLLNSIDESQAVTTGDGSADDSLFEAWPKQFRVEARRYRPAGQRLLAATQWPAIIDGFRRELSPAGAFLVTEREFVLISEEKISPRLHRGDIQKFGGIITYFPLIRLADFHVSRHERFGVLSLQVHATHGGERLEIIFPADHEKPVSKALDLVRRSMNPIDFQM